jgi:hypothetical protein
MVPMITTRGHGGLCARDAPVFVIYSLAHSHQTSTAAFPTFPAFLKFTMFTVFHSRSVKAKNMNCLPNSYSLAKVEEEEATNIHLKEMYS